MKETKEDYPCGPCSLPLICSSCGGLITEENVVNRDCDEECEMCEYCGNGKCPDCGDHWHCGRCI